MAEPQSEPGPSWFQHRACAPGASSALPQGGLILAGGRKFLGDFLEDLLRSCALGYVMSVDWLLGKVASSLGTRARMPVPEAHL